MKIKECPRCGSNLVEETLEPEKRGPSEEGEASIIPSGCSIYSGSIDVYTEITKARTIYRCPNPECRCVFFDC